MIIQISLSNYRSIHAEQTLSFVAEKARRHPDNLIVRPGYKLLKAAALFGANASGKSNFVRAIGEMRDFVRDSATKMNDGDPIACAQPFRLDPDSRNAPSRFEITFVTEGLQYVYGFAATRERVHEEWLTATRENRIVELLRVTRNNESNTQHGIWNLSGIPHSLTALLVERTRPNALFLSVAARENVKELLPAYRSIREKILRLDMSQATGELTQIVIQHYGEEAELNTVAQSLLRDIDAGIDSFRVKDGALKTYHKDTQGSLVEFDLSSNESIGTQKFLTLFGPIWSALYDGAFLIIDELDASMHPLLTRKLLEMFQSPEANPNGAQLLFTTHDATLLDSALFRRDQIVLAEKCDNESRFYSLADIVPPPRSTASYLNNYLVGRYGATPYLGRAFDTLTVGSAK